MSDKKVITFDEAREKYGDPKNWRWKDKLHRVLEGGEVLVWFDEQLTRPAVQHFAEHLAGLLKDVDISGTDLAKIDGPQIQVNSNKEEPKEQSWRDRPPLL